MSKVKGGASAFTRGWHSLVDTLRLLPSIQRTGIPSSQEERDRDLRAAQNEKRTLDDAYDQLNALIRMRREQEGKPDTAHTTSEPLTKVPSSGAQPSVATAALPGAIPSIATPKVVSADSPASLAGTKRKQRPSSISASPAPPASGGKKPQHSAGAALSGSSLPGDSLPIPGSQSAASRHDVSRTASPHPSQGRSGTPNPRQLTSKERSAHLADQLPLLPGRRVAFRVPAAPKKGDGKKDAAAASDQEWILAVVVRSVDKGRYEVKDADEDPDAPTYTSTLKNILPLPDAGLPLSSPGHPDNFEEYPPGTQVLGLFHETTSFYRATVASTPSTKSGSYQLIFEDDYDQKRRVPRTDVVLYQG